MKTKFIIASLVVALIAVAVLIIQTHGAEASAPYDYVTIRWGGRDNTHLIRAGGKVEFLGQQLRNVIKPDRTDERSLYMNIVMNSLAKEGYEFAGMTNDEIVMKRVR